MRQIFSLSMEIQLSNVSLSIPSKNQRFKFTLTMLGANTLRTTIRNYTVITVHYVTLFCTLLYVHIYDVHVCVLVYACANSVYHAIHVYRYIYACRHTLTHACSQTLTHNILYYIVCHTSLSHCSA